MAAQRKQETVQFLFEASPDNNITRCVISKTSNTFENNQTKQVENDEERPQNDTVTNQSSKTFGSNEDVDRLKHSSSARWVLNKGRDSNYTLKTQQEIQQNNYKVSTTALISIDASSLSYKSFGSGYSHGGTDNVSMTRAFFKRWSCQLFNINREECFLYETLPIVCDKHDIPISELATCEGNLSNIILLWIHVCMI